MSQQIINISNPDDGLGDALRNGFDKSNQNFTELYNSKVDKVAGKGLSENDFTNFDKAKLDGIEAGAQVNVQADAAETDPLSPSYIQNFPPSLYSAVGHFHYADLATQTTPLAAVANVPKKITNDTLGANTELDFAPYAVPTVWDDIQNSFVFSNLDLGDSARLRLDLSISTTSTNQTIQLYLKFGVGTASEYDLLIDSWNEKSTVTFKHFLKTIDFSIDNQDWKNAPAELFILSDANASVKVNGFYIPIIRKSVNIVNFTGGEDFKKKSESAAYNDPTLSGSDAVIQFQPNGESGYAFSNAGLVSIDGFGSVLITGNPSAEVPYPGKDIFIFNNKSGNLTLKHNGSGTADVKFYFADETDLIIPPGGKVWLKYGPSYCELIFKSWSENELPDEDIWTYFKGDLYMCQVTGVSLSNIGYPANPTLVGTGTFLASNLSGTYNNNPSSSWNHRRQTSASTAGSNASLTWGWANVSCGLGFYTSTKVDVFMTTNGRFFLGLTDSTSDIGNINPSTLTNVLGFGIDSLDTNLQILHNDNTGTATKVDLGADFSINATRNNTYLLEIWNFQGSSTVYFRVKNLLNGITSSITEVTTDLPTVTAGLAFHLWSNNGTDASQIQIKFSNHSLKRQS